MVTREEVLQAYTFFLGRPPESEDVITAQMAAPSIDVLRKGFLSGLEFQNIFYGPLTGEVPVRVARHLDSPPISVQLEGPEDQRTAMIERVARTWRDLGAEEPHWSVVTKDEYRQDVLAQNLAEFYESGHDNFLTVRSFMARNGITIGPDWTAFELGCGVARVTAAMSGYFNKVVGCDISQPHLEIARAHCEGSGLHNVSFVQLTSLDVLGEVEPFDFFFSLIVLQHNPPPVMAAILDRIFARLNPGGVVMFQVPTYEVGYDFKWERYLASPVEGMEMHVLPQPAIFELFARHGLRCIEVQEDAWSGRASMLSHTFFARKETAPVVPRQEAPTASGAARRALSRLFGGH